MAARPARGTIREVDGRYRVRMSLGRDGDRRLQRQQTVDTLDEAEALLEAWRTARDAGRVRTMRTLFDEYHRSTRKRRTQRSDEEVRRNIDVHLPPLFAVMVDDVTVEMLERFYDELATAGLADGTIRHVHYIVRPALRLAVRWGWRDDNPAELVDLGPLRRRRPKMPPDGVVRRVVARCGLDPDLDLFVRLLITTGARRGEIAALRWVHVDWTSSVVIIDEALSETRTGVRIKETKTSSSTRRVGLDGDTLALLARRREAAGGYDEDWVFGGEAPVAPNVWSQRFARACAEVGVNLRMHDLRHWAASVWIDAGVPINVIAGRLGHARTSTTTDIYGHLLSRDDSALAGVVLDRFAPRDSG